MYYLLLELVPVLTLGPHHISSVYILILFYFNLMTDEYDWTSAQNIRLQFRFITVRCLLYEDSVCARSRGRRDDDVT
jgi:hypothetical protein